MKPTRPKPTAISAPAVIFTSWSCVSAPPCIHRNAMQMPADTQEKVQEMLTRIINEGSGGMICILL